MGPVATSRGNVILLKSIPVAYLLTYILILLADIYPYTRWRLFLYSL